MSSEKQVINGGEMTKKFDVLKCSGDSHAGGVMRLFARYFSIPEYNFAFGGLINTADTIKNSGLTSAIWSYNGEYSTFLHIHRNAMQGYQTSERNPQILY
jgi:hypothetical protein